MTHTEWMCQEAKGGKMKRWFDQLPRGDENILHFGDGFILFLKLLLCFKLRTKSISYVFISKTLMRECHLKQQRDEIIVKQWIKPIHTVFKISPRKQRCGSFFLFVQEQFFVFVEQLFKSQMTPPSVIYCKRWRDMLPSAGLMKTSEDH